MFLDLFFYRYGVDDGDDSFEDESRGFGSDDELDQLYQRNLQQQLFLQRLIEKEVQKQRGKHCCCKHRTCQESERCIENEEDKKAWEDKSSPSKCDPRHKSSKFVESFSPNLCSCGLDSGYKQSTYMNTKRKFKRKSGLQYRIPSESLNCLERSSGIRASTHIHSYQSKYFSKSLSNSPHFHTIDEDLLERKFHRIKIQGSPLSDQQTSLPLKSFYDSNCAAENNQNDINQTLPKGITPTQIIASPDEICVIIESK